MKLTLKYDCLIDLDLKNYLITLKGIEKVVINDDIYIEYDSNLISIKVIVMEIDLFLKTTNIPSLIAFDKHSKNNLVEQEFILDDLCCEYCLKSSIADLLLMDGIESVWTNYNYNSKDDIKVFIKYDEKKITKEKLKKVENEFILNASD